MDNVESQDLESFLIIVVESHAQRDMKDNQMNTVHLNLGLSGLRATWTS